MMLGARRELQEKLGSPGATLRGEVRLLGAFAALIIVFVIFGGLSPIWAVAGFVAGALALLRIRLRAEDTFRTDTKLGAQGAAERVHSEHSELWHPMLDAVPDAALVLDREQRVVGANSGAQSVFPGIEGRALLQTTRDPELVGAVDRALKSGQPQTFDMHAVLPVERHYAGIVSPLGSAETNAPGPALMIVLRDRTEAEQLAQMRADFVANASHELRTPLASLKGFVETLQGAAKDDPKARERFLGIMQEQAARMSRLIDDLLSLSRIEMREHVQPTGRVDLEALVADAVDQVRPLAEEAQIAIRAAPTTQLASVVGDRDELMQVAQNLLQNAIKYGKLGGQVDVVVSQVDGQVLLSVADDGIGIAPQHLPRLTERFYRVSAKDSRERGGTGLGLAIVKHIVNRHRGELRIESTPGKGSTFTVAIPAAINSAGNSNA